MTWQARRAASRACARRARDWCARLRADQAGTPVVEFALVLPVLLTAYLGSYVALDAVSCSRKVSMTASQVTDVTSRYMALTTADLDMIEAASAQMLQPYDQANAMVRISQVQVCAAGYNGASGTVARVVWSRARNGTALTTDTTGGGTLPLASPQPVPSAALVAMPSNMLATGSPLQPATGCSGGAYFIYGEVTYQYTSAVKMFLTNPNSSFTFRESSFLSPRGTTSIGLT